MMQPMRLCIVLALAAAVTGCSKKSDSSGTQTESGGDQTLSAAIKIICEAPNNLPPDITPDQRVWSMAQYLDGKVRNQEARKFMAGLASADPATRNTRLREKAHSLGITPCPLADDKPAATNREQTPPADETASPAHSDQATSEPTDQAAPTSTDTP